jgi:branched-subunit amino acid transport protein AzlD
LIVPVALCRITIYNIHNVNGLPQRELLVLSMWQSVNIMYIIYCYSTESYWYYQCGNPLTLCILYIVILQRATGTINALIVPPDLYRITIYNIHNINGLPH